MQRILAGALAALTAVAIAILASPLGPVLHDLTGKRWH